MQPREAIEITGDLQVLRRRLVVAQHYSSLYDVEGLAFCGFLADTLHNLPMLAFDMPAEQQRYRHWIGSLDKQVPEEFRSVLEDVYSLREPSGTKALRRQFNLRRRLKLSHNADEMRTNPEVATDLKIVQLPPDDRLKPLLSVFKNAFVCIRTICFKRVITDGDAQFLVSLTDTLRRLPTLIIDWSSDAECRFYRSLKYASDDFDPLYAAYVDYILDAWH